MSKKIPGTTRTFSLRHSWKKPRPWRIFFGRGDTKTRYQIRYKGGDDGRVGSSQSSHSYRGNVSKGSEDSLELRVNSLHKMSNLAHTISHM